MRLPTGGSFCSAKRNPGHMSPANGGSFTVCPVAVPSTAPLPTRLPTAILTILKGRPRPPRLPNELEQAQFQRCGRDHGRQRGSAIADSASRADAMARAGGVVAAAGRAIRRVVGREQTPVETSRSKSLSFQRSVQRADEAARRDRTIATGRERSGQTARNQSTSARGKHKLGAGV